MNLYSMLLKRQAESNPVKVGVIGAGKFSSMFLSQARLVPGFQVVGIADLYPDKARESCLRVGWPLESVTKADKARAIDQAAASGLTGITDDAFELIKSDCEVIMEITGDPEVGTEHAVKAMEAGKHVIMINVEADCLLGPALTKRANQNGVVYAMAYGDQPSLIMEQIDWARTIGMEVVCVGKGTRYQPEFHYSTPETVWGHYGFSEEQVASGDYNPQMFNSFLDGSKSAIEMCAVANGAGLTPPEDGLKFPPVGVDQLAEVLKPRADGGSLELSGTVEVIASEDRQRVPVPGDLRWGVYVVMKAPTPYVERCFKEYGMKTDSTGKYSALYRPYHYIGLELGVSAAAAALRKEASGQSLAMEADVAATAKKDLKPGDMLDGEGGYTVFGKLTTAENSLRQGLLPLGLCKGAKVVRPVAKGQGLAYQDVELASTGLALTLRKEMEQETRQRLGL